MEPDLDWILDLFGLTPDQREAAAERGSGPGRHRRGGQRQDPHPGGALPGRCWAKAGSRARWWRSPLPKKPPARCAAGHARRCTRWCSRPTAGPEERLRWAELDAQMDSARIGTIHSLCAEILRSHPAEAGLDPQFRRGGENQAAALRAAGSRRGPGLGRPAGQSWRPSSGPSAWERWNGCSDSSWQSGWRSPRKRSIQPDRPKKLTGRWRPSCRMRRSAGCGLNCARPRPAAAWRQRPGRPWHPRWSSCWRRWPPLRLPWRRATRSGLPWRCFQARRRHMTLNMGKKGRDQGCRQGPARAYDLLLNPWLGGERFEDLPPDPGR